MIKLNHLPALITSIAVVSLSLFYVKAQSDKLKDYEQEVSSETAWTDLTSILTQDYPDANPYEWALITSNNQRRAYLLNLSPEEKYTYFKPNHFVTIRYMDSNDSVGLVLTNDILFKVW